ncbi:hypothetical protein YC2023_038721 [Brassica napus]
MSTKRGKQALISVFDMMFGENVFKGMILPTPVRVLISFNDLVGVISKKKKSNLELETQIIQNLDFLKTPKTVRSFEESRIGSENQMAYASRIIIHSNKLKHVSTLLRREHSVAARGFSNSSTHPSLTARDYMLKTRPPVERISKCRATTCKLLAACLNRVRVILTVRFFCLRSSSSQMRSVRGFSSGSDLPPHQEIGMPSLSPTMTEAWTSHYFLTTTIYLSKLQGNIARWLKKEGDKVAPGEVLCEVETDKATVEMECMEEGYLAKILKEEGAKAIQVGEVIAITVEEEEDIQKFKDYTPSSGASPAAPEAKSAPSPPKEEKVEKPASAPEAKTSKPSSAPSEDRIFASPLAKKLAEDNNVPLSSIKATGPEGRIVKADVEEFLGNITPLLFPLLTLSSWSFLSILRILTQSLFPNTSSCDTASRGKETTAKPSKPTDSKVTASRLAFSKQTIPHYYLTVDTCVDKMMGLRSQLNSFQETNGGKRISVNDLVIKAAALALRKVPQCNSSWTDEYIRQFSNVNINVAVQTENGLYVPVVKDADKKGLSTIGEEVRFLAQKAKENSLKPEDYEGGTFTVSNLGGPFGIKQFCAVINPPQAAILAIGSGNYLHPHMFYSSIEVSSQVTDSEKRVVAGGGPDQFNVASYMSVTLSCDHRVIDGTHPPSFLCHYHHHHMEKISNSAIGAEWLKAFKGYIETPEFAPFSPCACLPKLLAIAILYVQLTDSFPKIKSGIQQKHLVISLSGGVVNE